MGGWGEAAVSMGGSLPFPLSSVHRRRDQVTSGVLNYSAAVDTYRAGPCMKCHHIAGHGAMSCSFGQAAAVPVATEVTLAHSTQPSAVRVDM